MNLNIICHGNKYIDLVANQQNENQNDKLENIAITMANHMKLFLYVLSQYFAISDQNSLYLVVSN